MENRTKTGLLLLLITQVLAIVSVVVMYSMFYTLDLETITSENAMNIVFTIIPAAILGGIGAIIGLIGAIFILLGRKEFGPKHQKFIFYAIIIFVISIVVAVALTGAAIATTLSSTMMGFGGEGDPAESLDTFRNSLYLPLTISASIITTILGGLIWLFALYHLENETGKRILYLYVIIVIAGAIITGMFSYATINDYLQSVNFEELITSGTGGSTAFTQLTGYSQWFGQAALISVISGVISNIILLYAIYIPYKRISSGELVPVSTTTAAEQATPSRKCPNCGQSIPFDAKICPYCSKQFEDFL